MSRIFNLVSDDEQFQLAGYRFQRVAAYDRAANGLPGRGSVTRARVESPEGKSLWVHDKPHSQGVNGHTFDAHWSGTTAEPAAMLVREAPLLCDLTLLLTLWGERRVFHRSDSIDPTESPYYWPDEPTLSGPRLLKVVEDVVAGLRYRSVPAFPFDRVLALLIESDRNNYAELKAMILTPCFDLVCAATPPGHSRGWTDEEQAELVGLRKKLNDALAEPKWPRVVADSVGPFRSDIARLGTPRAADNLAAYHRWALAPFGLPDEVIASHAKATNTIRNAIAHRAASPERISVKFTSRAPLDIPKGAPADDLLRALLYFTFVNHAIIKRHSSALLGLPPIHLQAVDRELRGFFANGTYNGVRVFDEWFQDSIIG